MAPDSSENYVPSVAQHVLWYYFGQSAQSKTDLLDGREPFYVSMLALSKWQPPAVAYSMTESVPSGYEIQYNSPRFSIWDGPVKTELIGSSFVSDDFALATSNAVFNPAGYLAHQTFSLLFKSSSPTNEIQCLHPYFNSNHGEDAWPVERWSPFQQTYRYDNDHAVMLFSIPQVDPYQYGSDNNYFMQRNSRKDNLFKVVMCRVPRAVDELVQESNWVFVRHGNTYIALGTLNGTNTYPSVPALDSKYLVVKVREAKTALFFKADLASNYASFAAFKAAAKAGAPTFSAAGPSVTLTEKGNVQTQVTYNLVPAADKGYFSAIPKLVRNGVESTREAAKAAVESTKVFATPFMTLGGGELSATDGVNQFNLRVDKKQD